MVTGFVENQGQLDREVEFFHPGSEGNVYFTSGAIVLDMRGSANDRGAGEKSGCVLKVLFEGANPGPSISGRGELPTRFNYFRGSDPEGWRSDVKAFGEVVYQDLWPGIDLVFRESGGRLTYEIVASPGADRSHVKFQYEGADQIVHSEDGSARLETPVGVLVDQRLKPGRESGCFTWEPAIVGREKGTSQRDDSDLVWSTFLGGTGSDYSYDIVKDSSGCCYVIGFTESADFPTTPGAYDRIYNGGIYDAYVTKLNPSGSTILYSTFIGGDDDDRGHDLAVDEHGNVYLTGSTSSVDFPTTAGAYDNTLSDGYTDVDDAFVVKLNGTGSALVYSTYLGGTWWDYACGIGLDAAGCAYVVGNTFSNDFPITPGALDSTRGGTRDGFVTKLNSSGSGLEYSTFIGGSIDDHVNDIAVRGAYAYVVGHTESSDFPTTTGAYDETFNGPSDGFVAWIRLAGDGFIYSTYLGGSSGDEPHAVALDSAQHVLVAGRTVSADFPVTAGAYDDTYNGQGDATVTRLSYWGTGLDFSTYIGGSGADFDDNMGIAVDTLGRVYICGKTKSADFPTTPSAYDDSLSGVSDVALAQMSSGGDSLCYSTYIGGGATDDSGDRAWGMCVDEQGSVWVVGDSREADFPTTGGCYDSSHNGERDAVVFKMYLGGEGGIVGAVTCGGDPIGGATVTAVGPSTGFDTTGPNGAFHIPGLHVGTYTVTVTAAGYYEHIEPEVVVAADQVTTVDVFLTRQRGAVEGTVTLARGPIEGAVVTAVGEVTLADTTDAAGYYLIEDLPIGLYDITATAVGYNPQTKPGNEIVPDDTITVDFSLDEESGAAEGIVSGFGGFLAGAIVVAEGESIGRDTTDGNGHYFIGNLLAGAYDLYASAPGHFNGAEPGVEIYGNVTTEVNFSLQPFNDQLVWSGFLGGGDDDEALGLFVDYTGSVFLAGTTCSPDFPATTGAYDTTLGGEKDAFVAKLNPDNSIPFFVTLLGGDSEDEAVDIAVDGAGFPFITGITASTDFPTTLGAYNESHNGDLDVFVTKLQPGGNGLAYSTFIGGTFGDEAHGIALRGPGEAYVIGATWSFDFPTTPGAYQPGINGFHYDVFACQLDPTGSNLSGSTYLGGQWSDIGTAIAVDAAGNAYLSGFTDSDDFPTTAGAFDETYNDSLAGESLWDTFVAKLGPGMNTLAYSTYLGGIGNDEGWDIALDDIGNTYIAGETNSEDFPVTPGAFDTDFVDDEAYVTKLNPLGNGLVYSTFLGGSEGEEAHGIVVDDSGYAYVTGYTGSPDFPTTDGCFDTDNDGCFDDFVVKLGQNGQGLAYSTYMGGRSDDQAYAIGLGGPGIVYVTGKTESYDFPVTGWGVDDSHNGLLDVFVSKLQIPEIPTGITVADNAPPAKHMLYANHPNPFNPTTGLHFTLPRPEHVVLSVHDVRGRHVALILMGDLEAGEFAVKWNGKDDSGREVGSGTYIARLQTDSFTATRKMVLIR